MTTHNGSARAAKTRRRPRIQEEKITRQKKTPIDQSNFAEMSSIIRKYLEDTLSSSKKGILNSEIITGLVSTYLKKYPLTALSSAALLGGLLSVLINRTELFDFSLTTRKQSYLGNLTGKLLGKPDDSLSMVTEALNFVVMQIKDHSIDLYDELVDNFLKKHPLQTTLGALTLGVVLTLLMRRD